MTACTGYDDGRHRWRFAVSRWAGTPHYACDRCAVIALPMGDDAAEDAAYLAVTGEVMPA